MSVLVAPYRNSMRMGQGFNTYTQEICIDDAVIVSKYRPENMLTNDGTTMRSMARQNKLPSVWLSEPEVSVDNDRLKEAEEVLKDLQEIHDSIDSPVTEEETKAMARQQQVRALLRKEVLDKSVDPNSDSDSRPPPPYQESNTNFLDTITRSWRIDNAGGPSQEVTFTSKFVDRLSEVTKDLAVSASLSIKSGTVDGSGRGSFIDCDSFLKSDLNYYISVKVANQTINFKDPLEFNPMLNDSELNESEFTNIYGDSFISGFLEGGEFNAIVSMNILNSTKLLDIQAAAKVAFNSGAIGVTAQAAFGLAKSNLTLNTETTISASWIGGGIIKPPEEPWTIDSLIRAAVRFPENVARSPQRTYATLMKYENLRSYLAFKTEKVSAKFYEHVISYTDELMEFFMSYKSLATQLQNDIRDVHQGYKRLKPKEGQNSTENTQQATELKAIKMSDSAFPATVDGLQLACRVIRANLSGIITRVELLKQHPEYLNIENSHLDPGEQFQTFPVFYSRLPKIEELKKGKASTPLTGLRIGKKSLDIDTSLINSLCESEPSVLGLTGSEEKKILACLSKNGKIGEQLRMSRPMGSRIDGTPFFGIDFVKSDIYICSISVGMLRSRITSFSIRYSNGLQWSRGSRQRNQKYFILDNLGKEEYISSGTITTGKPCDEKRIKDLCIVAINLQTNFGRSLQAQAKVEKRFGYQSRYLDCRLIECLEQRTFDCPFSNGRLISFQGTSIEESPSRQSHETKDPDDLAGLYRLSFLWQKVDEKSKNPKDDEEVNESKSNQTESISSFTMCEPICKGSSLQSITLETDAERLEEAERTILESSESRLRFCSCIFGPPVIGSGRGKSGTVFNDLEWIQKMDITNRFPSNVIFKFQKETRKLASLQVHYGRYSVIHGPSFEKDGDCLEVKLSEGQRINEIRFQPSSPASQLPTGISIKTISKTSSNKSDRHFLNMESRTSINLREEQCLLAPSGTEGIIGFFGLDTENELIRLLPIWG